MSLQLSQTSRFSLYRLDDPKLKLQINKIRLRRHSGSCEIVIHMAALFPLGTVTLHLS